MSSSDVKAILVMGVSGSGKSTVAEALAQKLGWEYFDADDYHPQANVDKMASGTPLNDTDRLPWLEILRDLIKDNIKSGKPSTLACSALKESYRSILRQEGLATVYLYGDFDTIWKRMQERQGHYMKADMLKSQFDVLEEPEEKGVLRISVEQKPEVIVEEVLGHFKLS